MRMTDHSTQRNRKFEVELVAEQSRPVFQTPFTIINATLRFSLLDGSLCQPVNWVRFERGDGAAVLLHDEAEDSVVLVRQFRYPVFARMAHEDSGDRDLSHAWVLEVIAGSVAAGEDHLEIAQQELLEEAGYQLAQALEPISTFYVSPGAASEKIILFYGRATKADRVNAGGGVGESEDIEVVTLPLGSALAMLDRGEIYDAKTIIGLQWLARRLGR